ncbi:MAG: class I SAM-dependent methyltransferase, partial [Solirubrobacterales bacterium]
MSIGSETAADAVRWHELECGGYAADLPLWKQLAAAAQGPVLELGCGTGRVALRLAHEGQPIVGVDRDAILVAELERKAARLEIRAEAQAGELAALDLGRRFALALAPMQVFQMLDPRERPAALAGLRAHLQPGGLAAIAIAEPESIAGATAAEAPLPDIREIDGTVYSSRPVAVREAPHAVSIERIRETVDRAGYRTAEGDVIWLDRVDAAQAAAEATAAGLTPLPARRVPP